MAGQDLLVAQRAAAAEGARLERLLRALERPGVLEGELLEHDDRALPGGAIGGPLRGGEAERALEAVGVMRSGPVSVVHVPARFPDQDLRVREDLEVAHVPF